MRVFFALGLYAVCIGCGGRTLGSLSVPEPRDAGADGSSPAPSSTASAPPEVESGPSPLDFGPAPPLRTCSTDANCLKNEICSPEAPPVSACRRRCTLDASGQGVGCDADQLCDGQVCRRMCHPFRNPSDCAAGEWCQPPFDPPAAPNWPAGIGTCVAGNDLVEGQTCSTGNGCGPNLRCTFGALSIGRPFCSPACDDTGAYENSGCARGACSSVYRDTCLDTCTPFGMNTCPDGFACFPFDEADPGALHRAIRGHCIRPGTLSEGAACDPKALGDDTCGAGLDCAKTPSPFAIEDYACRRYCRPEEPKDCKSGESCVPFFELGFQPIGICFSSCALWQSDPGAGCGAGGWCAPRYRLEDAGICALAGNSPPGSACTVDADCAAGTLCRCLGNYGAYGPQTKCAGEVGRCDRLCAPGSKTGDPGACASGEVCFVPEFANKPPVASKLGFCQEGCDYDAHVPCTRPDQDCVPHEISGYAVDSCFDHKRNMPCDPIVCGPMNMCIEHGDGSQSCMPVCRESAGALDSDSHPDCPTETPKCAAIPATTAYGICQ